MPLLILLLELINFVCVLVLEDVYAYAILVHQITTLGSWFLLSTLLRQGWSCFCHLIASWLAGP